MPLTAPLASNRALYLRDYKGNTEILAVTVEDHTRNTQTASYNSGNWKVQPTLKQQGGDFFLLINADTGTRSVKIGLSSIDIGDASQFPINGTTIPLTTCSDEDFNAVVAASGQPVPPTPPPPPTPILN